MPFRFITFEAGGGRWGGKPLLLRLFDTVKICAILYDFAQKSNKNAIKIFGGLYFLSLSLWPEL